MKGEKQSRDHRKLAGGMLRQVLSKFAGLAGLIATDFAAYSCGLGLNRPDHDHHGSCSGLGAVLHGDKPARIRLQRSAGSQSLALHLWRTLHA